jgi:type IX secretion system PorP/SprF family membrane protein
MQKKIFISGLLLFLMVNVYNQDFFFSQFYASPLNLNPALTGLSKGDMRVALNYRDQNQSLVPYSTYSGSFDMKILRATLDKDAAAFGMSFVKDDLNNNALSTLYAVGGMAYHFALNNDMTHYLAFGFQGGILQRQINMDELSFPNQWTIQSFYDPTISHGLDVANDQTMIIDMNAGMFWYHFLSDNSSVFAGFSAFHMLEPQESVFENDEALARKYIIHGGSRMQVGEQVFLIPNFMFMQQNSARQIAAGTNMEYLFPESDFLISFGAWYRYYNHSVITNLGIGIKNINLGVSYDIFSQVQSISETRGGLEFSLIYSPKLKNVIKIENNPGTSY